MTKRHPTTSFVKASLTAYSQGVPPTNGRFRNLMR